MKYKINSQRNQEKNQEYPQKKPFLPDSDQLLVLFEDQVSSYVLEDPEFWRRQHLPHTMLRVALFMFGELNHRAFWQVSQKEIAHRCGTTRQTVSETVAVLVKYGLLNKISQKDEIEHHKNKENVYGLPASLRDSKLRRKLSCIFKVLLCATIGSLLSMSTEGSIQINKGSQTAMPTHISYELTKERNIRSIIRNDRIMSSVSASQKQDFSEKVKKASNSMPEERPNEILSMQEEVNAFLRRSSFHERLALEVNTGYEDPFVEDYREKAYSNGKKTFERKSGCSIFGGLPYKNPESGHWYNVPTEQPVAPAKPMREDYTTEVKDPLVVYSGDQWKERAELRKANRKTAREDDVAFGAAMSAWRGAQKRYVLEMEAWDDTHSYT